MSILGMVERGINSIRVDILYFSEYHDNVINQTMTHFLQLKKKTTSSRLINMKYLLSQLREQTQNKISSAKNNVKRRAILTNAVLLCYVS